jgi:hypothetical protein
MSAITRRLETPFRPITNGATNSLSKSPRDSEKANAVAVPIISGILVNTSSPCNKAVSAIENIVGEAILGTAREGSDPNASHLASLEGDIPSSRAKMQSNPKELGRRV